MILGRKRKIKIKPAEKAKLKREYARKASKITPKSRASVAKFIAAHRLLHAGFGRYRSRKRGPITWTIHYDKTGKPIARDMKRNVTMKLH